MIEVTKAESRGGTRPRSDLLALGLTSIEIIHSTFKVPLLWHASLQDGYSAIKVRLRQGIFTAAEASSLAQALRIRHSSATGHRCRPTHTLRSHVSIHNWHGTGIP